MRTRKRQEKAVPLTYRGHRREARQDAAAAPAAAAIAVQGCKLLDRASSILKPHVGPRLLRPKWLARPKKYNGDDVDGNRRRLLNLNVR